MQTKKNILTDSMKYKTIKETASSWIKNSQLDAAFESRSFSKTQKALVSTKQDEHLNIVIYQRIIGILFNDSVKK